MSKRKAMVGKLPIVGGLVCKKFLFMLGDFLPHAEDPRKHEDPSRGRTGSLQFLEVQHQETASRASVLLRGSKRAHAIVFLKSFERNSQEGGGGCALCAPAKSAPTIHKRRKKRPVPSKRKKRPGSLPKPASRR